MSLLNGQETVWHLCGIALVVAMYLTGRMVATIRSVPIFFLYHLLGTTSHEIAHLLCAKATGAKVVAFNIIPKVVGDRVILGYVKFQGINAFNAVPIAFAPLGLAVIGLWFFEHWFQFFPNTFVSTLGRYFFTYILIYNSLPSRQDLRIAMNWRSVFLYAVLTGLWFMFADVLPL